MISFLFFKEEIKPGVAISYLKAKHLGGTWTWVFPLVLSIVLRTWGPQQVKALSSFDISSGKLLCKPNLSGSCDLFLLLFKQTICFSKLAETVEVEIPANRGIKCCIYRGHFILSEIKNNTTWNIKFQTLSEFAETEQESAFGCFSQHRPDWKFREQGQVFKANMPIFSMQSVFISCGSLQYFLFILTKYIYFYFCSL